LGAARAGFDVRLAIDNDAQALAAHSLNFPNVRHSDADISVLTGDDLLRLADLKPAELAGLIGGPPCQGFSRIGLRETADSRNDLFLQFFSLVRQTRPKFYVAENVPGILDSDYRDLRSAALSEVQAYVNLDPFKLCASKFGAPTDRTRVLFVGYLPEAFDNEITSKDFAAPSGTREIFVREALKGLPTKIRDAWLVDDLGWRRVRVQTQGEFWQRVFGCIPDGVGNPESLHRLRELHRVSGCIATNHTKKTRARFAKLNIGEVDAVSRARRLDPKGVCPTIRAGTGRDHGSFQAVRPIHPKEDRVITPREAARLQGFPDWYRFAPTKWHSFRQIGNSVSPLVAEHVLKGIRQRLIASDARIIEPAA
jgi:DNA (cytosine-5)-methyltransferase 1